MDEQRDETRQDEMPYEPPQAADLETADYPSATAAGATTQTD
ncbi:MAG TPA: hypothetical protein VF587_13525 [Solirubrobacteraceae bacterium]|jgi:hypothetical protein